MINRSYSPLAPLLLQKQRRQTLTILYFLSFISLGIYQSQLSWDVFFNMSLKCQMGLHVTCISSSYVSPYVIDILLYIYNLPVLFMIDILDMYHLKNGHDLKKNLSETILCCIYFTKPPKFILCLHRLFYFVNIYQTRNCRVSSINKHRLTKMYLSQFLITSAETS